jgi:hypothetical protein
MKCNICRKHDITIKDYRFIDSCGLQGKVLVCNWCWDLNDDAIREVIRDELDPKEFYELEEEE